MPKCRNKWQNLVKNYTFGIRFATIWVANAE